MNRILNASKVRDALSKDDRMDSKVKSVDQARSDHARRERISSLNQNRLAAFS